jgi:hypothetical protein
MYNKHHYIEHRIYVYNKFIYKYKYIEHRIYVL